MKRRWIQAVCILLVFVATSTVASTSSVAESGSTITIPALSSTVTPVVDGTCATTEYGDANQIEVNSVRAKIYLKRTAHDLYICFGEMYVVFSPSNIINMIVYIDRNAQGEPDDDNFRIVQPVSVNVVGTTGGGSANYWQTSSADYSGGDPGGWQSIGRHNLEGIIEPGGYFSIASAEFRIHRSTIGGWKKTIGLGLFYQVNKNGEDYHGWPANNAYADPSQWGNALLPTGELSIGKATTVPTIDGFCNLTEEWRDAASVGFPIGQGFTGNAYAKHSDTDLYVCLVLRKPVDELANGPNAAVYINRVGDSGEFPGPDAMVFTISYNGNVRANRGNGVDYNGPDPGGYEVKRQIFDLFGTIIWHAEYKINQKTLGGGGWNRAIDISFAQQWLNRVGDDYGWPNAYRWTIPSTWGVGRLVSAPAQSTVDVKPIAIEVTQSIQDLQNSVTLIAGKRTFARVHLASTQHLRGVTARLYGYRKGVLVGPPLHPVNPGAAINIVTMPNRALLDDSFLFELPYNWITEGELELRVMIDPYQAFNDNNFANNSLTVAGLAFQAAQPIHLRLVNYQYPDNIGQVVSATTDQLDALESRVRREFPFGELVVTRRDYSVTKTFSGFGAVNSHLARLRDAERRPYNPLYYGAVNNQGGGEAKNIPSMVASGGAGEPETITHELGHALNRHHAEFCKAKRGRVRFLGITWWSEGGPKYPYPLGSIGGPQETPERFYGFDSGDQALGLPSMVLDPQRYRDIMTYCHLEGYPLWSSDHTYLGIREYIEREFALEQMQGVSASAAFAGDYLALYGELDLATQQVNFTYAARQSSVYQIPPLTPGPYHIRLYSAANELLADYPFMPQADLEDESKASIHQIVEFPPGTQRIVLFVEGFNRDIVALHVSIHAPTVSIVQVNGVGALPSSGPVKVQWAASDADADPLTYTLLYSFDNRTSWRILATTTSNEFTLDGAQLEGTDNARTGYVRVIANDGVLEGFADSEPFLVAGKTPEVDVITPAENTTFVYGQTVTFVASASDFEDGTLAGSKLTWTSSINGALGTGHSLSAPFLAVGDHIITITAIDSDSQTATANVKVRITPAPILQDFDLQAGPNEINIGLESLSAEQSQKVLSIRNNGQGLLNWVAQPNVSWVKLNSSSGVAPADIQVSVDTQNFQPSGVYTGSITVNGAGKTLVVPVFVTVGDEEIQGLTIQADGNKQAGNTLRFSASVTQGTDVDFLWNFDDGATANGQSVNHAYTAPGDYTVEVLARNNRNEINTTVRLSIQAHGGSNNQLYLPLIRK